MNENLRPPQDVLQVVETFAEAKELLAPLASRSIGGICIRGAAAGYSDGLWRPGSELERFAYEATSRTRGYMHDSFTLEPRRMPCFIKGRPHRQAHIFSTDSSMHIDGFFVETKNEEGEQVITVHKPLINEPFHPGVSHHITTCGATTFVMERLNKSEIDELALNQKRVYTGVTHTNPLPFPVQGEAVDVEAGDYITFYAFATNKQPIYIHGTIYSSPDRQSIVYTPQDQ